MNYTKREGGYPRGVAFKFFIITEILTIAGTQCDLSTEAQQSSWIGKDDIDAIQTETVDTSINQEIDIIVNIETDADTFREDRHEDETDDESLDEDFEWETETETESDMEADFIGDR